MDYINEAQELTQQAQNSDFVNFAEKAKEILMQKTAEKLAEKGYFRKLDNARGIFEKDEDKGKEKDDDEDNEDDEDNKKDDDEDED